MLGGGGVVVGSPVGGLGGGLRVGIELGGGLGLGLDVGEVGWLDPIAGGGRLEEEEAGGVIGLEIGLGKALGEGQESPEHLCDFWRPCRNSPNPKTRPKTTNTVTMKMKIFVAFPT